MKGETAPEAAGSEDNINPGSSATAAHIGMQSVPCAARCRAPEWLDRLSELEACNEALQRVQVQLQAELARYAALYESAPSAYFTLQPDGCIAAVNPAGGRLLGIDCSVLSGTPFVRFVAEQDRAGFEAFLRQLFSTPTRLRHELGLCIGNAPYRVVQIEAAAAPDRLNCHVVAVEITELKRFERRLQLAASVFSHAREGIIITDLEGKILDVNDAFTQITGYSRDEMLNLQSASLSCRQGVWFDALVREALLEHGFWSGERSNQRKNGECYAAMITFSAVRDEDGCTRNYVGLITDITRIKEQQQQLEHLAHYDVLTGLPNRVLLADRLQQAMVRSQRNAQSVAVVYLDLDGFKSVNDSHGHNVGDELLVSLSKRMKAALREGDTLARIGGDEFVAVLADLAQQHDCKPVLERLLQAAAAPTLVGEDLLQVSASMGVTLYPQDNADADQLMRHADQAMYQAKQSGKNRYKVFDVDYEAVLQTRHEGLDEIRGALQRQEFVLYYQPKVNMRTGAVIGAEALIRWQHPARGLLLPADFLPLIEHHPLSIELGEWVIDTVLRQMAEWHAAGRSIPVSVNIGGHQLQQADFVTRLTRLLSAYPELQHHSLELEVLETSALEDMAHVSEIMRACNALGVRFALDDFGTGYSSLTYLKRLPAGLLKIDQSFVCGMMEDPDDQIIVEGVIGLVRAFRREVIAEGVETEAQGALLLALGCELAQGYGIARPMPSAELPVWVANWNGNPQAGAAFSVH